MVSVSQTFCASVGGQYSSESDSCFRLHRNVSLNSTDGHLFCQAQCDNANNVSNCLAAGMASRLAIILNDTDVSALSGLERTWVNRSWLWPGHPSRTLVLMRLLRVAGTGSSSTPAESDVVVDADRLVSGNLVQLLRLQLHYETGLLSTDWPAHRPIFQCNNVPVPFLSGQRATKDRRRQLPVGK